MCHSHQDQQWQAGVQSGMSGSSCTFCSASGDAGASLHWRIALLQRSLQQLALGFVPNHLCCFSPQWLWAEVMASAPSPETNTRLCGRAQGKCSSANPRQVPVLGAATSCPPAKDQLCAKAGSDRDNMSFTKPFWPLSFLPFFPFTLSFTREV